MSGEKQYIALETKREGYAPDQCGVTMTVRDLIDYLEQFDDDEKVYFSNDDGYTYGSIKCYQINEKYYDDEDEDYE